MPGKHSSSTSLQELHCPFLGIQNRTCFSFLKIARPKQQQRKVLPRTLSVFHKKYHLQLGCQASDKPSHMPILHENTVTQTVTHTYERYTHKRQVSQRPVSKRLKRQVYKTSGIQNVRYHMSIVQCAYT
jgi:hypothetical protein